MKKIELYFKYKEELEEELSFNVDNYIQNITKEENKDLVLLALPIGIVLIVLGCLIISDDYAFLYALLANCIYVPILIAIFKYINRNQKKNEKYQKALCEYVKLNFDEKQISSLLSLKTKKYIEKYIKNDKNKYEFTITSDQQFSHLDICLSNYEEELNRIVLDNIFEIFTIYSRLINDGELNEYLKFTKKVINYTFTKKVFKDLIYFTKYDDCKISYEKINKESIYKAYNINLNSINSIAETLTQSIYKKGQKELDSSILLSYKAYGNTKNYTDYILMILKRKEKENNILNEKYPFNEYDEKERIAYFLVVNQLIIDSISDYIGKRLNIVLKEEEKIREFNRLYNQASYQNRCWNCHTHLSSNTNEKCPICSWYICKKCGACSTLSHHG